jgi:hypothetical protein
LLPFELPFLLLLHPEELLEELVLELVVPDEVLELVVPDEVLELVVPDEVLELVVPDEVLELVVPEEVLEVVPEEVLEVVPDDELEEPVPDELDVELLDEAGGVFSSVATSLNTPETEFPTFGTTPIRTAATTPAIMPYSTAVTPEVQESSALSEPNSRKRGSSCLKRIAIGSAKRVAPRRMPRSLNLDL